MGAVSGSLVGVRVGTMVIVGSGVGVAVARLGVAVGLAADSASSVVGVTAVSVGSTVDVGEEAAGTAVAICVGSPSAVPLRPHPERVIMAAVINSAPITKKAIGRR